MIAVSRDLLHPGVIHYFPACRGLEANGRRPVRGEKKGDGDCGGISILCEVAAGNKRADTGGHVTEQRADNAKKKKKISEPHSPAVNTSARHDGVVLGSAFCRDFSGCTGGFLRATDIPRPRGFV